ncbi:hypothetical protein SAMN05216600_12323 [Pseudomonas cuatrocienegasensis]|uniref:DUF6794 domain-containing protein n=1 Tax=Pseudomonas cuatrocienegasensis TaxID=543360 RepID=A0ABY1BPS5_9PSED|nr:MULTISPECIES: DUF6794 domain-containing protein [Pseudomonas]SER33331.1 hypothetical protein SAMN05216600_12323 [Pseudomonas cuatrocienegasensis]
MRFILKLALTLIAAGFASNSVGNAQVAEQSGMPKTCKGLISKIVNNLDEKSIATLRDTEKDDLLKYHFSWGMSIRNSYELWSEDSPIRKSCAQLVGEQDIHPDNASSVIMEGVWEVVNNTGM